MSNNSTNSTLSGIYRGFNDTHNDTAIDGGSIANVIVSFLKVIEDQKRNGTSQAMYSYLFQYSTSIYGLTCLFMALLLNRTIIMASSNANQTQRDAINRSRGLGTSGNSIRIIKKASTIFFRLFTIAVLLYNTYTVLVALNLHGHIGVSGALPFFYKLIPDSLFSYSPDLFSFDKYMATSKKHVMVGPSSDMYWPIFLSFCLSAFVETFISSIESKKMLTETGITIFEHSLAFRDQSIQYNSIGEVSLIPAIPTEQMLVSSLFSLFNHLNIHVGSLINDNKYRLIPSCISGLLFLSYIIQTIFNGTFFQFPKIFVVIFLPQLLMLFVFFISICIFLLAIVFNNLSLQDLNCASIFTRTYEDDEEREDNETSIFGTRIDFSEDFYSAFTKFVVLVVNIAGKTSYIKELSIIPLDGQTWVERSIWDTIGTLMGTSIVDKKAATTALMYLRENGINGYSNMILHPSKKLTSGSITNVNTPVLDKSKSVFRTRYTAVKYLLKNLFSLIYGIVFHKFLSHLIPKFIKNRFFSQPKFSTNGVDESNESFEYRKRSVPGFLAKYMQRRTITKCTPSVSPLAIDSLTDEEIKEEYLTLLNGVEISEVDNSEDFYKDDYDDDLESVMESDSESIDASISGSTSIPALHELLGPDGVNDFVDSTSLHVLLNHIDYNGNGMMTRSKFRSSVANTNQTHKSSDSDLEKLVQLLLEKRAGSSNNFSHTDSLESKFDCVICQTNTREIITWPCKCFAICDDCRISLIAKGMEGCVCCRRDVEGVSKVFLP